MRATGSSRRQCAPRPSASASGRERVEALGVLQSLAGRSRADAAALDTVRRAIVDTLVHEGERLGLVDALDEFLLGVRPRPATALELQAAAR